MITPHASIASLGRDIGGRVAAHLDLAFRRVLRGPGVVSEGRFIRLITGEPHPFGNFAVVSETADPRDTEAAVEPLLHCGAPSAVMFLGEVAEAVEERLTALGFLSHGGMPAMAVEIDSLIPTILPADCTFTRVGSGPDGDEWGEAFSVGYELPRGVGRVFSPNAVGATTAVDAPLQYFAIRKDGKFVCTSLAYFDDGVAGIYCVATIPQERGRGLGAHATAEPLRLARTLGYRVGVLQSSHAGHSLYRRLGFTDFGEVPLYVKMPV